MKKQRTLAMGLLLVLLVAPTVVGQTGMSSYTNEEHKLQFSHPAGWVVVEQEDGLFLLSDPSLESKLGDDYPDIGSGDVVVNIAVLPVFMFAFMGIEAEDIEGQIEGFFDQMMAQMEGSADNVDQQSFTASSGVTVTAVSFDSQEEVGGAMETRSGMFLGMAKEEKGVFGFGIALGLRPTLDRQRRNLVNTIGSIVYTGTEEELFGGN